MALYLLVTRWYLVYGFLSDLEGDTHIFHLPADGVLPKCVSIIFIKQLGLFDVFWYSYAKLVSPYPVLGLHLCNYLVSLL